MGKGSKGKEKAKGLKGKQKPNDPKDPKDPQDLTDPKDPKKNVAAVTKTAKGKTTKKGKKRGPRQFRLQLRGASDPVFQQWLKVMQDEYEDFGKKKSFDWSYAKACRRMKLSHQEFSHITSTFKKRAQPHEYVQVLIRGGQHLLSGCDKDKILTDMIRFCKERGAFGRIPKSAPAASCWQRVVGETTTVTMRSEPIRKYNCVGMLQSMLRPFAQLVFNRQFKSVEEMISPAVLSQLVGPPPPPVFYLVPSSPKMSLHRCSSPVLPHDVPHVNVPHIPHVIPHIPHNVPHYLTLFLIFLNSLMIFLIFLIMFLTIFLKGLTIFLMLLIMYVSSRRRRTTTHPRVECGRVLRQGKHFGSKPSASQTTA